MNSGPNPKPPNVIIFIMDAARANHFSCYGYEKKTTPNVDRLASQGVLYEQCISPGSWTLESMASMFTGLYPSQHGTNFNHQYLEPQFKTIAETLNDQGYQTALFATVEWISEIFGMNRGFETETNYVQGIRWMRRFFRKTTKVEKVLRLARWYLLSGRWGKMTREVELDLHAWFAKVYQPDQPYFIVAHLSDPHWPWFRHPGFTQANGSRRPIILAPDAHKYIAGKIDYTPEDQALMFDYYDGEIRFLDSYLGRMLDWLQRNHYLENTLVVLTADHGEEIAEHGLIGHGWSVYEQLLHVPFVLYHPKLFAGGQRVPEPVQSTDLFPTLLDLAQIDRASVPNPLLGRNLLPDRVQSNPRAFTISERLAPSLKRFERVLPDFDTSKLNRQLRALRLRGPGYKLIWGSDGRHELYNLAKDPDESDNLAEIEPDHLKNLVGQLEAWLEGLNIASFDQLHAEMEEELAARLQDLGYL